ncbi:MAG TPA: protein phosphatase 2C domain-containing protein [Nakamurella sp.]
MGAARIRTPVPGGVMDVVWGARTDKGRVRKLNEDAYLTEPPVFLVADGMGGYKSGETASAAVIDEFRDADEIDVSPEWVTDRLGRANTKIRGGAGGGTTATGAALVHRDGRPYWLVFNIGDSRVYLRSGSEFRQISVDHSVVQELVDAGRLAPERARFHPERHIVTKAVGTAAAPRPDFWLVPREPGDRLLLCSDGVSSELDDDVIAGALRSPEAAQEVAEALTELALRAGGRDNITCVVIDAMPSGDADSSPGDDETRPRPRPDLGAER